MKVAHFQGGAIHGAFVFLLVFIELAEVVVGEAHLIDGSAGGGGGGPTGDEGAAVEGIVCGGDAANGAVHPAAKRSHFVMSLPATGVVIERPDGAGLVGDANGFAEAVVAVFDAVAATGRRRIKRKRVVRVDLGGKQAGSGDAAVREGGAINPARDLIPGHLVLEGEDFQRPVGRVQLFGHEHVGRIAGGGVLDVSNRPILRIILDAAFQCKRVDSALGAA